MTTKQTTEKEGRRHNSSFAKKRVQWLIEHSTSHQLLCFVDSFVLRNPLLRKAANRYTKTSFPNGSRISQLPFFVALSEHRGLRRRLERSGEMARRSDAATRSIKHIQLC